MSLVIFDCYGENITYHNIIIENVSNVYENTFIYDYLQQKDLSYFVKNKDSRVYEGVIDYCEKNKIEFLFIPYLSNPEYLLAELNYRRNLKTKISFITNELYLYTSKVRMNVFSELIGKKQILKVGLFLNYHLMSTEVSNKAISKDRKKIDDSGKLCKLYDPVFQDAILMNKEKSKKIFKFKKTDFVVLFFGSMFYGKGLDILLEAMNKIDDKNIKLFIASNAEMLNFNFNIKKLRRKNIKSIIRYIEPEEKDGIFNASDIIVLPYRSSYVNGSSGVLTDACQYKKLLVAPDFYPFKNVIEKYKIGATSANENIIRNNQDSYSSEIARAIFYLKNNYNEMIKEAMFEDFINEIQTWDELAMKLFKGAKI